MASSDDESESLLTKVSNYSLVDENNEPISFSKLPIQFNPNEPFSTEINHNHQVFLHGAADSGLQKIYKQVIAWKFDISDIKPEMFVLLKENKWVQLLKPRKSFEDVIRSVLITVWCLCFVKRKTEVSGKPVWDYLSKEFSSYEIRPSENDLLGHKALISEAVKQDETLAKSKFLVSFLEGKPGGKKTLDEEITPSASFIVDDDMIDAFEEDVGSDDEEDLYDTVCAICDNGGDILCCDGRCMRSFHATEEAGSDSYCESLGWSDAQVEATQSFICENCQHKQHQCFACGELGSSDKLSGAEVFPCVSATCGRFYHLTCVAKLLHRDNADMAEEFQKKVSAGGTFTCPIHKCIICKQGENKTDPDLQFAVCRRCPKSYHRKCLPRKIGFEDDEGEGILQRAWEGLIPNRILIYCLKHEIDDELKTPLRNHIKFPGDESKKKKQPSQQLLRKERGVIPRKSLTSEDDIRKRNLVKVQKGVHLPSSVEKGNMSKQSVRKNIGQGPSKKLKGNVTSKDRSSSPALGDRLFEYFSSKSSKGLPEKEHSEKVIEKPAATEMISSVRLDNDSKRRIMALVEDATSSVTMEHIVRKQKIPKTHVNTTKYTVDKTITLGKVEGSVEAIRAALQKLEEGGSIEDAKAVCEPGLLQQISRWRNKMKVYLSPFLYGMRYTSFGRHFTKVDKLKEIVNVLHRYVQDDDMIVDFCCGANDFSWLLKTKLDEIGKKCLYKNYDILQAKNDFNFERRDWTTVQPNELPEGSRLIMGLNPPFGVQASLANKFIDKALEFKPKLLILIVPKETERLDKKKKTPYDLIWEDNELLAGKSFYLPGSVDVNDNQLEDWNISAPPLYLWSRPDWTSKHMAIAQQHGHLSTLRESAQLQGKEDQRKSPVIDLPLNDHVVADLAPIPVHDHPVAMEEQVLVPETLPNTSGNLVGTACDDGDKEIDMDCSDDRVEIGEDSKKGKPDKEELVRESVKPFEKNKEREQRVKEVAKTPGKNKKKGGKKSYQTQFNATDDQPSRLPGSRSEREVSRERDYHLGQNMASPGSLPRTGYGVTQTDENEIRRRLTSDDLYAGPTNRWPGPDPDFGVRNIEEEYVGYRRESLDTHGFIPPHITAQEQYARLVPTSRGGFYNPQEPLILGQRSSYLGSSQDPGYPSPYTRIGSTIEPRVNSSTMQRYAPRLDEMNHLRTNNAGYDQFGVGRSGNPGYDQFGVARPGNTVYDQYGIARTANQPDYRLNSSGFALGPRSFTPHNSSGWLNE